MTPLRLATASTVIGLGLLSLGACGNGLASAGSTSSLAPTSSTAAPGTASGTPTLAPTEAPPSSQASASSSTSTTRPPNPAPTTSAPATVASVPGEPQAYATAFVRAWVARDRMRANQLAVPSAVADAFAHRASAMPQFRMCEGAMGSSYCTWRGAGYTLIVRVLNEEVRVHQRHAVIEARFGS